VIERVVYIIEEQYNKITYEFPGKNQSTHVWMGATAV
jgi:hypothetical protein